jgi:hypothetical protein
MRSRFFAPQTLRLWNVDSINSLRGQNRYDNVNPFFFKPFGPGFSGDKQFASALVPMFITGGLP